MRAGEAIGTLVKTALLVGAIYGVMKWQGVGFESDEVADFAERACIDAIGARYSMTNVRVYAIDENSNGYTVRATATMNKGGMAKVVCLANKSGGVRELSVTE